MSLFIPVERASLLILSGSASDPTRNHLFILLNNPVTAERLVLLVSLSTVREGRYHDPACVIEPDSTSNRFIKKTSFVDYSKAMIEPASKLLNGVRLGVMAPQGTVERELFGRICAGVMASKRTPQKCRAFFSEHIRET